MATYSLYGRLTGRGRQLTATGSKDTGIRARVETTKAGIEVSLHADGTASVIVGAKSHSKAGLLSRERIVWQGNIHDLT